jgi:ketopantoate reductase
MRIAIYGTGGAGGQFGSRLALAGRPSELDAWNGAVVRLAAASGVDVPTHAFLYAALLPIHRQGMATLDLPA